MISKEKKLSLFEIVKANINVFLGLVVLTITAMLVTAHLVGSGAMNSYSDYSQYSIGYKSILSKKGSYYVYMYSEDCTHCATLKPYIFQYLSSSKNDDDNGVRMYLFCVDEYLEYIAAEDDNILGVSDYSELKVSGTPTMMLVEDGTVTNSWASVSTIREQLSAS